MVQKCTTILPYGASENLRRLMLVGILIPAYPKANQKQIDIGRGAVP